MRSSVSGCGPAVRPRPRCGATVRRRAARQVERVLHVARGMVRRHVERFEVVVVVLDLRAFEHLVAQAREDVLAPRSRTRLSGWRRPSARRAARQRDVHGVGRAARSAASAASRSASAASTSRLELVDAAGRRLRARRAAAPRACSMQAGDRRRTCGPRQRSRSACSRGRVGGRVEPRAELRRASCDCGRSSAARGRSSRRDMTDVGAA